MERTMTIDDLQWLRPGQVRTDEEISIAVRWCIQHDVVVHFTRNGAHAQIGKYSIRAYDIVNAVKSFHENGIGE